MRVLVDTSVWSLALRKKGPTDHPSVRALSSLLLAGEDVFLVGLVLQEVLQAFRSEKQFQTIAMHLEPFALLPLERSDFVAAASLHRRCAAKGLTASTVDCQIATASMRHNCRLLTADEDFKRIARVSDLKLLELK
jgi:predicted nucleic acid-binding protein